MRKYLAFDIETVKVLPASTDWQCHRPLGIACAAMLASDTGDLVRCYGGVDGQPADSMNRGEAVRLVQHLIAHVEQGYELLTWNGIGFDFDILAEESGLREECKVLALNHVDMMFHVFCELGYPIGLDAAARGMNIKGKSCGMTGWQAPVLWRDGRRDVLEYVAQDVRTTLELTQASEEGGYLRWIAGSGKRREMPLSEGWLPVHSAQQLPEPDTSWMYNPWPRAKFTAWLSC